MGYPVWHFRYQGKLLLLWSLPALIEADCLSGHAQRSPPRLTSGDRPSCHVTRRISQASGDQHVWWWSRQWPCTTSIPLVHLRTKLYRCRNFLPRWKLGYWNVRLDGGRRLSSQMAIMINVSMHVHLIEYFQQERVEYVHFLCCQVLWIARSTNKESHSGIWNHTCICNTEYLSTAHDSTVSKNYAMLEKDNGSAKYLVDNQATVGEVEFVMRSTMSFPARIANSTVSKPFSPDA